MIDPTAAAGEFVAEQIVSLVTGQPNAFELDAGGFQPVDQPGSETFRLLFLESDQRWVLACVPVEPPEAETPDVPQNAVVLSPAD